MMKKLNFLLHLLLPEISFWPANTRIDLKFLRCVQVLDLFLNCCSDIDEKKWKHYFVISLCLWIRLLHCLEWVFSISVSGFRLKFSHNSVSRERLRYDSKTDLMTNGQMDRFRLFLEYAFFHWLSICLELNLQELLKLVSSLTTSSFSKTCLRWVLVCSWNTLLLFSYWVLQYRLISFSFAMQH